MQEIYKDTNTIGFDLDGTLAVRWEARWLEGATELLQELAAKGKRVVVATNQGGVACGLAGWGDFYPSAQEVIKRLEALDADLPAGIEVEWRVSIFYPDALEESDLHAVAEEMEAQSGLNLRVYAEEEARKPGTKMLRGLEVFIGDSDSDRLAAEVAGIEFVEAR